MQHRYSRDYKSRVLLFGYSAFSDFESKATKEKWKFVGFFFYLIYGYTEVIITRFLGHRNIV